jgi:hypothetical protein
MFLVKYTLPDRGIGYPQKCNHNFGAVSWATDYVMSFKTTVDHFEKAE